VSSFTRITDPSKSFKNRNLEIRKHALFNRFREFPAFQQLIDALSDLHASELRVVDAEAKVFGPESESLAQCLKRIQPAVPDKIAASRELHPSLVALQGKLIAHRKYQAEITQQCALTRASEDIERRTAEAPDGASPISEREIAAQIQKANVVAIDDMKGKFLEELAVMLGEDTAAHAAAYGKFIEPG
jgi:hypothetical protein